MKVSVKEISKYVDIKNISLEELASKLTFSGVEVEAITSFSQGSNLIVGLVLECEVIEGTHLHLLKVDCGEEEGIKQIICGAPNIRKDIKVIVALPNCILKNGIIKSGNIRGIKSDGMICSLLELGVDSEYLKEEQIEGIEILDDSLKVGSKNVLELLELDDSILEINVLANRPDLNSIYNVAREVASLFNLAIKPLTYDSSYDTYVEKDFKVEVKTPKVERYYLRFINNITIQESPLWLKRMLNACGIRSINNIVDLGNYCMLLTGQPLHIYDADKLNKKEFVLEDGLNIKFNGLDESWYQILPEDIVILSDTSAKCLAGIEGGLNIEVSSTSKNIIIESAIFDPKSIRVTALRLGLQNESSLRFIKGLNHHTQEESIELFTSLLKNLNGFKDASNILKYDGFKTKEIKINTTFDYINSRLGTSFSNELILETLTRLGIKIIDNKDGSFVAIPPYYRKDILEEVDLTEEVIRVLGFDNISSTLQDVKVSVGGKSFFSNKLEVISDYLVANGFYQVLNYSLVDEASYFELPIFKDGEPIKLLHPLTKDHEYYRRNLLPSIISSTSYNYNRKNNNFKLFEISKVYTKDHESTHLSCMFLGDELYQGYLRKNSYSYFDAKGIFLNICSLFNIEPSRYKLERVEEDNEYFHTRKSAYIILNKKIVGVIGELHPNILKKYKLKNESHAILELDLTQLLDLKTGDIKVKEISKFPNVSRDLALIAKNDLECSTIISNVKKSSSSIIDVEIFDIYCGANIKEGYKSVAINIIINNKETTLKEEEITAIIDKVLLNLDKNLGVKIRE